MYSRPQLMQKRPAPRTSDSKKFEAPTAGWISNRNLASPMDQGQAQGAAILDNFFPTSTTVLLRRGRELYATLGDGVDTVTSMFSYMNGLNRRLFASTETTIYDITSVFSPFNWSIADDNGDTLATEDGDTLGLGSTYTLEVFEGATGGNWVTVQFATTGGVFLLGVNGESTGFIYDGTGFYPYTEGGVYTVSYDAETSPFTVGEVVTGETSGATGTVYEVIPGGIPGEGGLILTGESGLFQNNEALTGSLGGSATASSAAVNLVPGVTFPNGLTTADMSYIWVYKNRLWFAQKDSLNTWYMDAPDAIGGTPEVYPMGGIWSRGGHVIWGQSWSLGTGGDGGLSDQLAICSSEGEVAIFQGSYPEDVATWSPVGVYRIGTPLGNRAHFKGGGDIAVATSVSLVPLSKAISLDVTALPSAGISYNIQDAWQGAVDGRGLDNWQCEVWPERKMAIISPPITIGEYDPVLFVVNTETGAWCRYTNWDARCMEVFQGQLYFGGPNGEIYRANVSGSDGGATYTGVYVPLFEDFGTPSSRKVPKMACGTARAQAKLDYSIRFLGDYNLNVGTPPTATPVNGENAWGTGVWGQSVWGGTSPQIITDTWKSVGGTGRACSLAYQVTSGSNVPVDAEIIRLEMTYTTAEIIT